jgi:hypothetical protein
MMMILVLVVQVLPVVVSIDFVMMSFLLGTIAWDQHLYSDKFSTFKSKGVYIYIEQQFLILLKYKNYKNIYYSNLFLYLKPVGAVVRKLLALY